MTVLVASDLDRTLIYSAAALGLEMPDADAPRLLCVEVYQGKPLSYLTETAAALLTELAARAVFVPVTTRTRDQYLRVHLPGPSAALDPGEPFGPGDRGRPGPRFAICANGGHLLVDGRTDEGWHAQVRQRLAAECAPLEEVREHLRRTGDPSWLLKERSAEDLFAYLVVDRERLPETWVKELADWAVPRGWTVSLQGRKVYAVPQPLTKSAAVAEVARRIGAEQVLSAGDSLLDADLLLAADRGWRPGHGELADTGWSAPHITAVAERGWAAGERIIREMLGAIGERETAGAAVGGGGGAGGGVGGAAPVVDGGAGRAAEGAVCADGGAGRDGVGTPRAGGGAGRGAEGAARAGGGAGRDGGGAARAGGGAGCAAEGAARSGGGADPAAEGPPRAGGGVGRTSWGVARAAQERARAAGGADSADGGAGRADGGAGPAAEGEARTAEGGARTVEAAAHSAE